MSDTQSIYKSVLGLNETGGTNSSHICTINSVFGWLLLQFLHGSYSNHEHQ